jgi:hypothetical protein
MERSTNVCRLRQTSRRLPARRSRKFGPGRIRGTLPAFRAGLKDSKAEELMQEAMLMLWRRAASYD